MTTLPSTLVDLVAIYSTTTGTGAITLGAAVPGYRGVEALVNGAQYSYSIRQDSNYEDGTGTYLASGKTLTRVVRFSSNGNQPINLDANAQISLVANSDDLTALAGQAGVATKVSQQLTDSQVLLQAAVPAASAAALSATAAGNSASAAQGIVQAALAVQRRAALGYGCPPPGLIDLPTIGCNDYQNDYGIKFWSDGSLVWPLIQVTSAWQESWAAGGILYRDPVTNLVWRSALISCVYDPCQQGKPYATRYVNWSGSDSSNDGKTTGSPWKTLDYAISQAANLGTTKIVVTDNWIGTGSYFAASGSTVSANLTIVFQPTNGTGRTWFTDMRETYASLFKFRLISNGVYVCDNSDINDATKLTNVGFQLDLLDADNSPTPLQPLIGNYTGDAAIAALLSPGQWYTDSSISPKRYYVRLYNGALPVIGVNFAYVEGVNTPTILVAENTVFQMQGAAFIKNAGNAILAAIQVRPLTQTIPGPWVQHTCQAWFRACEAYGASGDAFEFRDMVRGGCDYRKTKYCRDDSFNPHTFQTFANVTPGDPNRTREGNYMHLWDFAGIGVSHGNNGFLNQPPLQGSSNSTTCHDQIKLTVLNEFAEEFNGALAADVSGANTIRFNSYLSNPLIADSAAVPKANFWCDSLSNGTPVQTVTRFVGGNGCLPQGGYQFAVTNNGIIKGYGFKGVITKKQTSGAITDFFGNPI